MFKKVFAARRVHALPGDDDDDVNEEQKSPQRTIGGAITSATKVEKPVRAPLRTMSLTRNMGGGNALQFARRKVAAGATTMKQDLPEYRMLMDESKQVLLNVVLGHPLQEPMDQFYIRRLQHGITILKHYEESRHGFCQRLLDQPTLTLTTPSVLHRAMFGAFEGGRHIPADVANAPAVITCSRPTHADSMSLIKHTRPGALRLVRCISCIMRSRLEGLVDMDVTSDEDGGGVASVARTTLVRVNPSYHVYQASSTFVKFCISALLEEMNRAQPQHTLPFLPQRALLYVQGCSGRIVHVIRRRPSRFQAIEEIHIIPYIQSVFRAMENLEGNMRVQTTARVSVRLGFLDILEDIFEPIIDRENPQEPPMVLFNPAMVRSCSLDLIYPDFTYAIRSRPSHSMTTTPASTAVTIDLVRRNSWMLPVCFTKFAFLISLMVRDPGVFNCVVAAVSAMSTITDTPHPPHPPPAEEKLTTTTITTATTTTIESWGDLWISSLPIDMAKMSREDVVKQAVTILSRLRLELQLVRMSRPPGHFLRYRDVFDIAIRTYWTVMDPREIKTY